MKRKKHLQNMRQPKKTGRDFEYLDYNDLLHWLFLNIDNFRGRFQHLLVDENPGIFVNLAA